jgi:hypothetical protein
LQFVLPELIAIRSDGVGRVTPANIVTLVVLGLVYSSLGGLGALAVGDSHSTRNQAIFFGIGSEAILKAALASAQAAGPQPPDP